MLLVIVNNLHVRWSRCLLSPLEADPPLIVNADGIVLCGPLPMPQNHCLPRLFRLDSPRVEAHAAEIPTLLSQCAVLNNRKTDKLNEVANYGPAPDLTLRTTA
jgi:hypothetical protein